MASQFDTTYPPTQSRPSLREKDSTFVEEKTFDVAYDLKPVHLNEFDAEPIEESYAHEEADILINDGNPFPEMPNAIEETNQLTVRAVVVGSFLGLIVGASNVYLGLKTGLCIHCFALILYTN